MNDEDNAAKVVAHILADSRVEQTRDYLARGRRFRGLTAGELAEQYVEAFRAWTAAPAEGRRWHSDTAAEFELRGLDPPAEAIAEELSAFTKQIAQSFETLSEERKQEINDDLIDEYLRSKRDPN